MSDEVLGEGRHLRLVRRDGWEFVARPEITGIVVILAVTDADEVVLVEQWRPPVAARVVDMPAGLVGDRGDEPFEAAARRELEEETGFFAERLEPLTEAAPSAGLSTEVITFYRAHGLERVGAGGGDETEDIEVHLVPRAGIGTWLEEKRAHGVLVDAKLYAGLYLLES